MPDPVAYALGMALIVIVLVAAFGLMRVIWWGAHWLRMAAEGRRLENEMLRKELGKADADRKAGFHGR